MCTQATGDVTGPRHELEFLVAAQHVRLECGVVKLPRDDGNLRTDSAGYVGAEGVFEGFSHIARSIGAAPGNSRGLYWCNTGFLR